MATFYYKSLREMEPRPGVKYSTTYIKQDQKEYDRLRNWLVQIAESIIDISNFDMDCAVWFITPMPDFRKAQRGNYYSPQDILTDMIDQMVHGRDLSEAMLGRWNRLTEGTPWQVELLPISHTTPQPQVRTELFV